MNPGFPNNDGNGADSGHARVFEYTGAAWTQIGADIDGEAAYDYSGTSVALSENGGRLAVGAPLNDGNGGESGQVRVFEFDGATWNQLGADIDGEAVGDESGQSVALSANGARLAVGAPQNGVRRLLDDDLAAPHGESPRPGHARVSRLDSAAVRDAVGPSPSAFPFLPRPVPILLLPVP